MNKSELRKMIAEEIQNVLAENGPVRIATAEKEKALSRLHDARTIVNKISKSQSNRIYSDKAIKAIDIAIGHMRKI